MDPQHPRPGTGAPSNDMVTAANDAGDSRHITTQDFSIQVLPTGENALPNVAKGIVAGPPREQSAPDSGMIRESWASFASTTGSRDSAVPSIFSARASTASAMTRYSVRQSLMESPISETSPVYHDRRKSSIPQGPRYCCTFCDAAFDTKTEWKLHEFESHDRRERYLCRRCPASFPRTALLAEHLSHEHGFDYADCTTEPVQYSPIRSAWGCGFCAAAISSRNDYLDHVAEHYEEGRDMSEWQHTRVIEGLLRQSKVVSTWMALVDKEESARSTKLRFLWDPSTTGRHTGADGLQNMLEFFTTGMRTADDVSAVAYSTAHIRPEGNVSDLISRLYLRNPGPNPAKLTLTPIQLSPELQPTDEVAANNMVSPISPLPAPLQQFSLSRPSSGPSLASAYAGFSHATHNTRTTSRPMLEATATFEGNTSRSTKQGGEPTASLPLEQNTLRRIDSARNLGLSKHAEIWRSLGKQGNTTPPNTQSRMSSLANPQVPVHRTKGLPRLPGVSGAPSATDGGRVLSVGTLNNASSVRPHTSSSTLSTHTGDDSQGLDDSTSEMMLSDDSVSEPDSWLESEEIPGASRIWKSSFQQIVTRGMERLWARYNHDWDALVRQCMGNKGGDSAQFRESSGRVRKGTSSRNGPSKGHRLHPLGQEDEGEDDEAEGYRPPSSMSKRSPESVKRFACPFRKHDPHTYNIHDHEVCTIRSWSTISRLKEHLYRRHYKTHCQRCKQIFNDSKELAEHEMSVMGCEVLDMVPPGDITTYQEKQLKSRKHTTRRQTDEEKWRDIYRLLFPNEEIPSPYSEPAEDMVPTISEPHVSLNFQHFLLTEMPGLVTKTAEEHAGRRLQAHDGLSMEAIPKIIEGALHKAFRTWEARGSELPTREASVASMTLLAETPTSLPYLGQAAAYPTPQPAAAMEHNFSQGHFGNTDFASEVPHASHPNDDSGFSEGSFFVSGPPVNFNNAFAPQYGRETWEAGLGLMGPGTFEPDMDLDSQYRGFQGS